MTITITAFERSPDGGKGLARDTRVRWALEEVGEPYEVRLVSFRAMKEPAHLALHPFGQIPTYEEGELVLFETGSIVFHIAERHPGLLPDGCQRPGARDHLDVRRGQHGGAADPRAGDREAARGRQALACGAPSAGGRPHPRPAGPTFRSPGRGRLARWGVQRGRPDDGVGAAPVETIGHPGQISDAWPPMSPAAKRGPPTSGPSLPNWRFTPASQLPADSPISFSVSHRGDVGMDGVVGGVGWLAGGDGAFEERSPRRVAVVAARAEEDRALQAATCRELLRCRRS